MIDHRIESLIKDKMDIVEVVEQFTTLHKRGVNYIGLCPLHDDRSIGSFVVSPHRNICSCWACNKKALDPIEFLMEKEKLSYVQALKWLAKLMNIDIEGNNIVIEPSKPRSVKQHPAIHINSGLVRDLYCCGSRAVSNPLIEYWMKLYQSAPEPISKEFQSRLLKALNRYAVGTIPGGYSVWWIVDETGWIRSGKAMKYKADGHRDKVSPGNFMWVHTHLARLHDPSIPEDAVYVGCLFGLHQLKTQTPKSVSLVESEKTAVLMSVFRPDITWMATMGLGNLNPYLLEPLINRGIQIRLMPDYDGTERWEDMRQDILSHYPDANIVLDTYVKAHPLASDKDDILDIMEKQWIKSYITHE